MFNSNAAVVKSLVEVGKADVDARGDDQLTPLHHAAQHNPSMVATLIAHKANVHLVDKDGWSPLHLAAMKNHVVAINALLKGGANVDQLNKAQQSPLFWAASENHCEAIDALLKGGANVNQLDKDQVSPLWLAARYNHREAVSALLDAGADPHLGQSPLDDLVVKDEMKKFIRERASRSE